MHSPKIGGNFTTEIAETTEKPKKQFFPLWSLRSLWFKFLFFGGSRDFAIVLRLTGYHSFSRYLID